MLLHNVILRVDFAYYLFQGGNSREGGGWYSRPVQGGYYYAVLSPFRLAVLNYIQDSMFFLFRVDVLAGALGYICHGKHNIQKRYKKPAGKAGLISGLSRITKKIDNIKQIGNQWQLLRMRNSLKCFLLC